MLLLFHESLSRLAEKIGSVGFWEISFTTLLQTTDNPTDFAWRGCWALSSTHEDAATGHTAIFDLTRPASLPALAPVEMPKRPAQRVALVQPTVEAMERHAGAGRLKSTWKKVRGSYEGLSEEELQKQLTGQIPVELVARRKRTKRIRLCAIVGGIVLIVLSGVAVYKSVRRGAGLTVGGQTNFLSSAGPPNATSVSVESARSTQLVDNTPQPTRQSPPPAETAVATPQSTLPTNELAQLPKVNTYFALGDQTNGFDVAQVLKGKLPPNCNVMVTDRIFTNFPRHDTDTSEQWRVLSEPEPHLYYDSNGPFLRLDDSGRLKPFDKTPKHVALEFADGRTFALVLLDTNLLSRSGVPFGPMRFSLQWLAEDKDKGAVSVTNSLAESLDSKFFVGTTKAQFRLTAANVTWGNVSSLTIDWGNHFGELDRQIKSYDTRIDELTHERDEASRKNAEELKKLLEGELGNLTNIMQIVEVSCSEVNNAQKSPNKKQDGAAIQQDNGVAICQFHSEARDGLGIWRDYLAFLRGIISAIADHWSLSADGKVKLLQTIEPTESNINKVQQIPRIPFILSSQVSLLSQDLKDRFDSREVDFQKAWAVFFTRERLSRIPGLLRTDPQNKQQFIDQDRKKERDLQIAMRDTPTNVLMLAQIQLEIQVGTNWWPLIEFKDKP